MKTIKITGENYAGKWKKSRTACRAFVIKDGKLLLSYAETLAEWMIPGGGLEAGETERQCCAREVAEETGFVIEPSECLFEIVEYYGNRRYVNKYFAGTVTGRQRRKPTAAEREVKMRPVWLPVGRITEIFSRYADYEGRNDMIGGTYLREYTAIKEFTEITEKKTEQI